ncbi:MAG: hypothetical protein QM778_31775 [Myxococcales bacterium]
MARFAQWRLPLRSTHQPITSRVFANWNLRLALCVLLCLLGVLWLEMSDLQRRNEHVLSTTVFSQLHGGVARAALPLPATIDPTFGFDIDAPRLTKLFRNREARRALAPACCSGARCTYHVSGGPPDALMAVVVAPGPYAFEVTQQSNLGEIRAHLALRVTP